MNKELIDLLRKHVDMWREIDQLFLRAESTQLADKAADALEAADKRIAELHRAINDYLHCYADPPTEKMARAKLEQALKEQVDG